jgi:hypothetical protein
MYEWTEFVIGFGLLIVINKTEGSVGDRAAIAAWCWGASGAL